jgi:RNA polymerase sigma-70 factor (ECF subfamily)
MNCGDDVVPPIPEDALEKARLGDRDAFRVLVERHATAVFRLAYRMTGNETDAEDMVQETFLRAWREIRRFDGRASFGTWLHRICANRTVDFLRSKNRWQPASSGGPNEEHDPFRNLASELPSPERSARSAQASAMLEPALATLSEIERSAFVLRHYEGLPIDEVASALGVQPGAARHSIFRAVRKLRRALEPIGSTLA